MIVCFDIGSTLVDGPAVGPVRRLAEALELPGEAVEQLNRLLFTQDPGNPEGLADLISTRYGKEHRHVAEAVAALWRAQVEEAYVLPGAREALDRLLTAGFRLAFISNIWAPFYQGFRRCLPEWADAYPSFLSFRMGIAKPDSEIYRRALRELGESPENAVMIGDTYKNDIQPARALGMKTIWLLHRPAKEKDDLVKVLNGLTAGPDRVLGDIGELRPEHLQELG